MFQLPRFDLRRDVPVLCLVLIGFQQLASAGYIEGKAHLAQYLIASAWGDTLAAGGAPFKPWPWADTWPVAKLEVPRHSVALYVLAGATGNTLAFGPGYELASAKLGEPGLSMIGGHRDTHFGFLADMKSNSTFRLQLPSGEYIRYRVVDARIVDVERDPLPAHKKGTQELQLVTCYPFDALFPGGPLRYVVMARPEKPVQKTRGLVPQSIDHEVYRL
ncbi:MAG: sortase A [Porticoccus sp.]|jgi:sortase A